MTNDPAVEQLAAVETEIRSARLVDVSYPKRQIELVVMPYEQEALVEYHGRMVTEICTRGAFDHLSDFSRVKVNRDHDIRRTCGRAMSLHPSRQEGLVAELYMSRTALGEETLTLADEGILDASAGFALWFDKQTGRVEPGSERWETRSRRRLNKLYLDHVALTPQPAYESAKVLAVRHASNGGTADGKPNLERLEIQGLQELYASLDVKYGVAQH